MKTTVYLGCPEWAMDTHGWVYASKITVRGAHYAGYIPDRWCWARVHMDSQTVARIAVWTPARRGWESVWEAYPGVPPLRVEAAKAIAVLNADVSVENTAYYDRSSLRAVMGSPE